MFRNLKKITNSEKSRGFRGIITKTASSLTGWRIIGITCLNTGKQIIILSLLILVGLQCGGGSSATDSGSGSGSGTAASSSEINIKVGGLNVALGSTYDFGSQVANSTSTNATIIIENTGSASLDVTSVTISGSSSSDFTMNTSSMLSSVGAGSTTSFTVNYKPLSVGSRSGVVTINNNDSNEGSYDINIIATASASALPEINIIQATTAMASGSTQDFGTVAHDSSSGLMTFTIQNIGTANLNLSGTPKIGASGSSGDFTITQPSSPIVAGASATFSVNFTPTSAGDKVMVLSIAHNDTSDNEQPYILTMKGKGKNPMIGVTSALPDYQSNTKEFTPFQLLYGISTWNPSSKWGLWIDFNGKVDTVSASSTANYTITGGAGLTITGASVQNNGTAVSLNTSNTHVPDQLYTLTITGVKSSDDTSHIAWASKPYLNNYQFEKNSVNSHQFKGYHFKVRDINAHSPTSIRVDFRGAISSTTAITTPANYTIDGTINPTSVTCQGCPSSTWPTQANLTLASSLSAGTHTLVVNNAMSDKSGYGAIGANSTTFDVSSASASSLSWGLDTNFKAPNLLEIDFDGTGGVGMNSSSGTITVKDVASGAFINIASVTTGIDTTRIEATLVSNTSATKVYEVSISGITLGDGSYTHPDAKMYLPGNGMFFLAGPQDNVQTTPGKITVKYYGTPSTPSSINLANYTFSAGLVASNPVQVGGNITFDVTGISAGSTYSYSVANVTSVLGDPILTSINGVGYFYNIKVIFAEPLDLATDGMANCSIFGRPNQSITIDKNNTKLMSINTGGVPSAGSYTGSCTNIKTQAGVIKDATINFTVN